MAWLDTLFQTVPSSRASVVLAVVGFGIGVGAASIVGPALGPVEAKGAEPAPNYEAIGPALPGTKPLTMQGDIAADLVAGVDRFLLRQLDASRASREARWRRDVSSAVAYEASIEPNRKRLAHILGLRDARVSPQGPEATGAVSREPLAVAGGSDRSLVAFRLRWPAFGDVHGEGLLLEPRPVSEGQRPKTEAGTAGRSGDEAGPLATVIVVPDADQSPEQLAGLLPGLGAERQVARRLAAMGFRVVVPTLIDRTVKPRNGRSQLTSREFLHRSAFELGRTLTGYEVQKVLALVDQYAATSSKIGVFGYGEGGAIALYAAAMDPRIRASCVSGYFDDRNDLWQQPVDRNVFGLLSEFGDAELASLVAPRPLVIEAAKAPEFVYPPGLGGAPGRIPSPRLETVQAEAERTRALVRGLSPEPRIEVVASGDDGQGPFGSDAVLDAFRLALLGQNAPSEAPAQPATPSNAGSSASASAAASSPNAEAMSQEPDLAAAVAARQERQLREIDRHNQRLLTESSEVRRAFFQKLDTSSLESYRATVEPYRTYFAEEVIGRFAETPLPPQVRSRQIFDEPKFRGYEVVMDVFPDVFAYGILLMPRDIPEGERRPVVVCQHGLEGRPRDVADPKVENPAYHRFAVRLAEEGFITFAPQNLYLFHDRFRTLQRKANPIGKTLFSVIVPQHQQITDWLKSLPQVDPARIGFYGLSYGGKSAMRIPPLVSNYALSICSADFNEWVWKNASTQSNYSYVWTNEYEIFEFDLGSTFNYAEMAALIAPRPFMVERGHFDGVAPDEMVAYEFAKVFFLYDARLKIGDRCSIEVFDGPHTINGRGTFEFLRKHLNRPAPSPVPAAIESVSGATTAK
jgi:dienelactone hydrolase